MTNLMLVHKDTGDVVKPGDIVIDFRGDRGTYCYCTEPCHPGSTGRAYVKMDDAPEDSSFGYYPSVFGLKWIEDDIGFHADQSSLGEIK